MPTIAKEPGDRVLSVGVAWYTQSYAALLGGKQLFTIDIDPSRAAVAGANHKTGDLRDLEQLFDDPFDVILMNGVIGYGLNHADDVEKALSACAARLKQGGTLILGINEERPSNIDPSSVPAHRLFSPRPFGRWSTGRVMVEIPFRERTHTFLFWRKL